jgi:Xaa-Pro aminopeptidase
MYLFFCQGKMLRFFFNKNRFLNPDGTTDVTRTIFIGTPEDIHKEVYTRLLSGCITLASTIFPMGANQAALDIMVRGPLYSAGMDFGHGTGHGIGHFGNVHEGDIFFIILTSENLS